MVTKYRNRIKRVLKLLDSEKHLSCLVLCSATEKEKARDSEYRYHQDADLFYLTGSHCPNLILVLSGREKSPVLIAPKDNSFELLWKGGGTNYSRLAQTIGAKLILTDTPEKELKILLRGVELCYHQHRLGSVVLKVVQQIEAIPGDKRYVLPMIFGHSDLIMQELRMYKDKSEIEKMLHAIDVTHQSLEVVRNLLVAGRSEHQVAVTLEYLFKLNDCEMAFENIVAAGPAAAVLHYHDCKRTIRKQDMVLIDCGAQFEMYNADITRVYPASGKFDAVQREIYEIVLSAQKAAIKKIRHGVYVRDVLDAALNELVRGLVSLGVLRGKISNLIGKQAYRNYFPHGIGHLLGIEVHDIGRARGNSTFCLKRGMVFTVEPGLYFAKKVGKVAAGGVRIEDDVLVTQGGCQVLSAGIPKELHEIER